MRGWWTDDRIERLTKLWQSGVSASTIAEAIGAPSRSAVIAKAHRLGLQKRRTVGRKQKRAPEDRKPRTRKPRAFVPKPVRAATPAIVERIAPPAPDCDNVTLADLRSTMCHWPLGDPQTEDFRYCGAAAKGVYCEHHAFFAYRPKIRSVNSAKPA